MGSRRLEEEAFSCWVSGFCGSSSFATFLTTKVSEQARSKAVSMESPNVTELFFSSTSDLMSINKLNSEGPLKGALKGPFFSKNDKGPLRAPFKGPRAATIDSAVSDTKLVDIEGTSKPFDSTDLRLQLTLSPCRFPGLSHVPCEFR